jgi:hypothetical protein
MRRIPESVPADTGHRRLNNPKHGVIIVVMQRLHVDDLAGHLIEQGGWTVLEIPAIAENDTVYRSGWNNSPALYRPAISSNGNGSNRSTSPRALEKKSLSGSKTRSGQGCPNSQSLS